MNSLIESFRLLASRLGRKQII